jgi:hypothetical protein
MPSQKRYWVIDITKGFETVFRKRLPGHLSIQEITTILQRLDLLYDEKGEREVNQMASACWGIRLDVARNMHALHTTIIAESKKPINAGERRKRLRTLVETLASWWLAGGGTSVAPYVKANRRDGDRAIIHGRSGKFLGLAVPYSAVWMLSKDRRSRLL